MSEWHLGTIGYSYREWSGGFYPPGMQPRDYLAHYSRVINSVEVDTTFHSLPRGDLVQTWKAIVPPGFKFSFKTPQVITHEMKLHNVEGLMTEFLDTIHPLAESLGPVLVQLPPSFRVDQFNFLHDFLDHLPSIYRYAVELRHASWYNNQTAQLLSNYHVCWVAIDFPNIPRQIVPTTDFLYVRWIGINGMYQHHSFERATKLDQLSWWLQEINETSHLVSDFFGYFNNDYTGFAAGTCKRFMLMAGVSKDENDLPYQERLF